MIFLFQWCILRFPAVHLPGCNPTGVICKVSLGFFKKNLHFATRDFRFLTMMWDFMWNTVSILNLRFHDTCLRFEHGRWAVHKIAPQERPRIFNPKKTEPIWTTCVKQPSSRFGFRKSNPLQVLDRYFFDHMNMNTLQGINTSHLGKRKIIFKMPFWGVMLVPWRVSLAVQSIQFEVCQKLSGRTFLLASIFHA